MPATSAENLEQAYLRACDAYAEWGVDVPAACVALSKIPISLHCWQGDDVGGFESDQGLTDGGIQATGAYPGKARNADELRSDLQMALGLIPGKHRLNLHAIYAETNGLKVSRDQLGLEHFQGWIDWARARSMGIDFNGTFFSHPLAAGGFTLASGDEGIRRFWIDHGIACRKIGEGIGRALNSSCITNVWIPDGFKDVTIDRRAPRERLLHSLDQIFHEPLDSRYVRDAVESKLFGIGSESFVVGSHEFYLAYALRRNTLLCIDSGHFHPTESIADKISSVMLFLDEMLLHVSRGVRWDSDHVVILSDELAALAQEVIRGQYGERIHIGLDFFDASINRVAAWVIGTRSMLKALLVALLEPTQKLRDLEAAADCTQRLALLEEMKTMPFGAVWDHYCMANGVPVGPAWISDVQAYEKSVLSKRELVR
jgi:L-rhamnose isomerase